MFVAGERMTQLAHHGDVARVPRSFWVDHDGQTIHLNPGDDRNPNDLFIEVAAKVIYSDRRPLALTTSARWSHL